MAHVSHVLRERLVEKEKEEVEYRDPEEGMTVDPKSVSHFQGFTNPLPELSDEDTANDGCPTPI